MSAQTGREDHKQAETAQAGAQDRLKLVLVLVASDLGVEGILQKLRPFVIVLNHAHT